MTKTDEAAPLVERLRSPWHHADCRAAADEIERLRMDLENTRTEAVLAVRTVQAAERERCASAVREVAEGYRATAWGKAAECIGDACIAAIRRA